MRRFGRPSILAAFGVMATIGVVLVFVGGRTSTKDRFLDEAGDVCEESKANVAAAQNALLGPNPSRDDVIAFLGGAYTDELRDRLDRLRAIDAPDGEGAEFAALLDDYAAVVDAIEADPASFAATKGDPFAAIDARLDDFGLPECGSAPQESE